MTVGHLNRRLHLYLGLALLPWLFMYGISSIPFAHNQFFERRDAARGLPMWTLRSEHTFEAPIPENAAELRPFAARVLEAAGITNTGRMSYGAYRQGPSQLNVYVYTFWKSTQVKYRADEKRLTVEDRRFRWDHFLTGMHARGGFEQEGIIQRSWSVMVDLVSVAILVWIATGVCMWWGLPGARRWGLLAILAGAASFVIFALRL